MGNPLFCTKGIPLFEYEIDQLNGAIDDMCQQWGNSFGTMCQLLYQEMFNISIHIIKDHTLRMMEVIIKKI